MKLYEGVFSILIAEFRGTGLKMAESLGNIDRHITWQIMKYRGVVEFGKKDLLPLVNFRSCPF